MCANIGIVVTVQAIQNYAVVTLLWHALQAVPLVIWPQAINGLLTIDGANEIQAATGVENYFARSLGLAQLTLGCLTVVLSGALPLTSMVDTPADAPSPYAKPTVLITMLHHGGVAFYTWAKYNDTDQTGFLLGAIGSATLFAFGLWCMLFAGDKGHVSKRTGADKRTSGFPFTNREAEKRKGL
ncbi:hypothetical protein BX600DRAFT_508360 [Xylariales sp. PMI_506]|nr:hypothetical protein BX600DRAFT_508360 [Xylariales sp. PMI_506]